MASPGQVMLLTSIPGKISRKVKSNRNRRLRRKRNKKFVLLKLKAKRAARTSDVLCKNLADIFNIQDQNMDIPQISLQQPKLGLAVHSQSIETNTTSGNNYLQGVMEWQHQNQVAYWKSRAIALQMENKALHAHIKFLYDNQMNAYLSSKNQVWQAVSMQEDSGLIAYHESCKSTSEVVQEECNNEEIYENCLPPSEQPGEARRVMMTELYGEDAAKINGMETAMQLNYEYCVKKDQVPYWPNIPLNL